MITTSLIFTCIVLLAAGALFAWFASADEFDGLWVSIGVMEGDRLVVFPAGTLPHTLRFGEDGAAYFIGGEQMPVVRKGRKLQVELAAQICIDYRLEIKEGRLIMTDPHGMKTVFERVEEDIER